ncbi:MAG: hypothetical protein ABIA97_06550 [Candidatus Omnitrophota bacterium]
MKKLLLMLLCVGLCNNAIAIQFPPPYEFKIGITTQQDVRDNFGEPTNITNYENEGAIWIYDEVSVEYLRLGEKVNKDLLFLLGFDKNGVLVEFEIQPTLKMLEVAPELILKEEDFTNEEYKNALKGLREFFDEIFKQQLEEFSEVYDIKTSIVRPKIYWEYLYIGIPNRLLTIEGGNLFRQKEIIGLKLENAQLKGASEEEISALKKELTDIEEQISEFLSLNTWVD